MTIDFALVHVAEEVTDPVLGRGVDVPPISMSAQQKMGKILDDQ